MKPNPTDSPPDAAEQSEPTQPALNYVTVYTFVVWDHDQQRTTIYPRMATLAAIARMRGKVNEDTAWIVAAADLDVEGFYSGGAPASA
jgi:hypothetical protein